MDDSDHMFDLGYAKTRVKKWKEWYCKQNSKRNAEIQLRCTFPTPDKRCWKYYIELILDGKIFEQTRIRPEAYDSMALGMEAQTVEYKGVQFISLYKHNKAVKNDMSNKPIVRKCRKCGCTEDNACVDQHGNSCYWVDEDLCSDCLVNVEEISPLKKGGRALGEEKLKNAQLKNQNRMKKIITIPASPLMEVLKKVKEVISKHPTITTLSNILIKVRRADIEIVATDLMVTIQATIEVKNDGEFGYNYLLPFDYLYNIGTLINGLDLTVEIDTIEKKVEGKKVKIINAILTTFSDVFKQDDLDNPEEFPDLPEFPQENSVGIGGDFILWLNKAIDTVSSNSTNQAMQKIFVGVANEGLCMASTNSHVVFEKSFKAESQQSTDLLVNTKIAKALKGFKETSISWSDTHIAFVSNGITMIGTIQAEKFPNYKGVFPLDPPANLRLSLAELTGVMDKAALTKKPATIYLKREIGHIVVESNDEIYNRKVTVRIGADYSGDCEQIIVDPEKMLLLLGQIEYTQITLSITGPDKPIIITSESDPTYRSLTMPLVN